MYISKFSSSDSHILIVLFDTISYVKILKWKQIFSCQFVILIPSGRKYSKLTF